MSFTHRFLYSLLNLKSPILVKTEPGIKRKKGRTNQMIKYLIQYFLWVTIISLMFQVNTSSGLADLTSSLSKMSINNLRHNALGTYEIVMHYYLQEAKRKCGEKEVSKPVVERDIEEGECSDSEELSSDSGSSTDSSGSYFFFILCFISKTLGQFGPENKILGFSYLLIAI